MKQLLFLIAVFITVKTSAQTFKSGDKVQVDLLMSSSREGTWQNATVIHYDEASKMYNVKLANGNEMGIPSRNPEKWIKAAPKQPSPGTTDDDPVPSEAIVYENRQAVLNAPDCNPSEAYIKRKIKALMARHFEDYPHIAVDITSFKGQHGYDDKKYTGQIVYPYKIEMLVHIKRKLMQGGKEYTEYRTWKFDRIYEYATRPGNTCEFYAVPSADAKLVSSEWH